MLREERSRGRVRDRTPQSSCPALQLPHSKSATLSKDLNDVLPPTHTSQTVQGGKVQAITAISSDSIHSAHSHTATVI